MNIEGIPDTIPLSKVQAFVTDLGIDATHLIELHIGLDGVFVEVVARDDKGKTYLAGNDSIATHRISMRLDRDA